MPPVDPITDDNTFTDKAGLRPVPTGKSPMNYVRGVDLNALKARLADHAELLNILEEALEDVSGGTPSDAAPAALGTAAHSPHESPQVCVLNVYIDRLLRSTLSVVQTGSWVTYQTGFIGNTRRQSDVKEWAFRIAEVLQGRYASWQQYTTAFEAVLHAWQDRAGVQDAEARGRVQRNVPVLVAQVWPAVEFKYPFE